MELASLPRGDWAGSPSSSRGNICSLVPAPATGKRWMSHTPTALGREQVLITALIASEALSMSCVPVLPPGTSWDSLLLQGGWAVVPCDSQRSPHSEAHGAVSPFPAACEVGGEDIELSEVL